VKKSMIKVLSLILVLIFTVSVLAACASKQQEVAAPVEPEKKEPVELVLWEEDEPVIDPKLDEQLTAFMNANPDIKISRVHQSYNDLRQNFTNAALAGEGPDIILSADDNLGFFQAGKLIQPIDDLLGSDLLNKLEAKAVEGNKFEGSTYGLSDRQGNTLVLIYNKKLVPEVPKTIEELIEVAKKNTDVKGGKFGLGLNTEEPYNIAYIFNGVSGSVLDAKGLPNINTPGVAAAYKFMHDIVSVDKIVPKDCNYDTMHNGFKDGNIAMVINGSWSFSEYIDKFGEDVGFAPIPAFADGTITRPYMATKAYMVNSAITDPVKKEAIKKFFELVASKEYQMNYSTASGYLPTNKEALTDPATSSKPYSQAYAEQLKNGVAMPTAPGMRTVWDQLKANLPGVITGKLTPEAAAEKAQADAIVQAAELGIK
jgi:maltose-binding protein MalE